METPPQASRRRSRPGCSTAVASLARHGICAVAARSSHAPAHAAPVQPLSWVCRRPPVGSSPCHQSLRSFSLRSCQPQPQTLPLRSRAGWSARLRWGGGAVSAANAGIKGAPSSPRSKERAEGWLFGGSTSTVLATRHEPTPAPAPCQAVRPVVPPSRTSRHRAASPQSEPLHVPVQWLLTSSGVERGRC